MGCGDGTKLQQAKMGQCTSGWNPDVNVGIRSIGPLVSAATRHQLVRRGKKINAMQPMEFCVCFTFHTLPPMQQTDYTVVLWIWMV